MSNSKKPTVLEQANVWKIKYIYFKMHKETFCNRIQCYKPSKHLILLKISMKW
jgi:hypothetical protein